MEHKVFEPKINWWTLWNSHPPDFLCAREVATLSSSRAHRSLYLVFKDLDSSGVEPLTSSMPWKRSSQLSYEPVNFVADGSRTHQNLIADQAPTHVGIGPAKGPDRDPGSKSKYIQRSTLLLLDPKLASSFFLS